MRLWFRDFPEERGFAKLSPWPRVWSGDGKRKKEKKKKGLTRLGHVTVRTDRRVPFGARADLGLVLDCTEILRGPIRGRYYKGRLLRCWLAFEYGVCCTELIKNYIMYEDVISVDRCAMYIERLMAV